MEQVQILEVAALASEIEGYNRHYREGVEDVPDAYYDALKARLAAINPNHPLLAKVEAEPAGAYGATVRHAQPMLSTDKLTTTEDVMKWVDDCASAGAELGLWDLTVRITPKIDGIAGSLVEGVLATRGDGEFGQDVSRAISRGLVIDMGNEGPGELAVPESFFLKVKEAFGMKHPRNYISGAIRADTLKEHHLEGYATGQMRFVRYNTLPSIEMPLSQMAARWESAMEELRSTSEYRTDGAVVEIIEDDVREAMGATSHHHRWMAALKGKAESASVDVLDVALQCGRTGRITPVAKFQAVSLSGAEVTSCTLHNVRRMLDDGVGPGAKITVCRQGEVIPFLMSVQQRATSEMDLSKCPSCGSPTVMDEPFLVCQNTESCPAQASLLLEHFFTRMGINNFGESVCETLAARGINYPLKILKMTVADFVAVGISSGIAANLVKFVQARKSEIVRDFEAVAAFGVAGFGRGDARKLLEVHGWQQLGGLTAANITAIHGFADKSAAQIAPHLARISAGISELVAQGFNIEPTVRPSEIADSPIKGKKIVFTGTMPKPRDEMEQDARNLGATVQGSVSAKTDWLIIGDKAGSKAEKAQALGVRIVPVDEYLTIIG